VYINESGFYSLILLSKKKDAKNFRKWVTSEVLPNIRKTGTYKSSIADITKIPALAYTIRKTLNTSWLYIIKIAKNTYKFGITMDIKRRLSEHGPTKNPSEVVKTYDLPNMNICKRLETFIKKLSKDLEIEASDNFSAEHFETNEDYPIDIVLGLIEQQMDNELKIYNDENNLDFSAQDKADIRKLECQIEASIQKMKLEELKLSSGLKLENDSGSKCHISEIPLKKEPGKINCKDCGKPVWVGGKFCQFCYGKRKVMESIKNGRPSYSQLKMELVSSSYVKLGKKYGVSDVCIKKWLNTYEKYGII
jgi:predicted GIY-YIG superfamily endonuclease